MRQRKSRAGSWRIVLVLTGLTLVAAACGGGDDDASDTTAAPDTTTTTATPVEDGALAAIFPDGEVTIAIANEVPYGYEDPTTGEPTGQAPELAKAILEELGIANVTAVVVDFGALIPGLLAGQYDMIAAGMYITPDRAEQILFSDPNYCGATALAVPAGNPQGLSDFESIASAGASVGVLPGSAEEDFVLKAGVPDDQVRRFTDTPSVFDALAAGRIDSVALTDLTIAAQEAAGEGDFESTPGFIPVVDGVEQLGCGGFGFIDQEFRDIFNAKQTEFHADDRILPLVAEFGFSETSIEKAKSLTVADLTE